MTELNNMLVLQHMVREDLRQRPAKLFLLEICVESPEQLFFLLTHAWIMKVGERSLSVYGKDIMLNMLRPNQVSWQMSPLHRQLFLHPWQSMGAKRNSDLYSRRRKIFVSQRDHNLSVQQEYFIFYFLADVFVASLTWIMCLPWVWYFKIFEW